MESYADDVSFLSEFETRKQYIDPELERQGWLSKYIKEEVNSVKSNFKDKNIILFDGKTFFAIIIGIKNKTFPCKLF